MNPAEIYDFEPLLEQPACAAIATLGIAPYSPQTAYKRREVLPRAEVSYQHGGELPVMLKLPDGSFRARRWRGTLVIQIAVKSDDYSSMSRFRSAIRNRFANFTAVFAKLETIQVLKCADEGATMPLEYEGGMLVATLRFSLEFGAGAQSFAVLAT